MCLPSHSLQVATPELLRSGDTVRWHGPYGSDSRRITAAAQRGDPQAAAFLTASTAQQVNTCDCLFFLYRCDSLFAAWFVGSLGFTFFPKSSMANFK